MTKSPTSIKLLNRLHFAAVFALAALATLPGCTSTQTGVKPSAEHASAREPRDGEGTPAFLEGRKHRVQLNESLAAIAVGPPKRVVQQNQSQKPKSYDAILSVDSAPAGIAEAEVASKADPAPQFTWPPPKPSASVDVSRMVLSQLPSTAKFADINDRLTDALSKAGYGDHSYYLAPGGFVIATRRENINSDGSFNAQSRFVDDPSNSHSNGFVAYLKSLVTARVGHYRVICFVVGDQPFSGVNSKPPTQDEANRFVTDGLNVIPRKVAECPVPDSCYCTALIYEYKRDSEFSETAALLPPKSLDAITHLKGSGLSKTLGMAELQ